MFPHSTPVRVVGELWNQEIEIQITLAVRMTRHIDRHVIDLERQIRAVVEG